MVLMFEVPTDASDLLVPDVENTLSPDTLSPELVHELESAMLFPGNLATAADLCKPPRPPSGDNAAAAFATNAAAANADVDADSTVSRLDGGYDSVTDADLNVDNVAIAKLALFLHKRPSVVDIDQLDSMAEWSELVAPTHPPRASTAAAGFADLGWGLPCIDEAATAMNTGQPREHDLATPVRSVRINIESVPPSRPTRKGPNAAGKSQANKLAIPRTAGQSRTGRRASPSLSSSSSPSPSPVLMPQLPPQPPSPPLDTAGVLPADHRPARGRGRLHQLEKMTRVQIEAEAEARLEKNRQAARDCRRRRKEHAGVLQERVEYLQNKAAEDQTYIAELEDSEVQSRALVAALRDQIQRLEKSGPRRR